VDAFECGQKLVLVREAVGLLEHGFALRTDEFSRDEQQTLPDGRQGQALPRVWQAEPTELIEQVVREDDQLEVGPVGLPVAGRDLAQGVSFFHLADDQLRLRTVVVEPPEVQWG
jgi:hypothetical protein